MTHGHLIFNFTVPRSMSLPQIHLLLLFGISERLSLNPFPSPLH
jgi:hypothetical protein